MRMKMGEKEEVKSKPKAGGTGSIMAGLDDLADL
jgi:hypothetical protein